MCPMPTPRTFKHPPPYADSCSQSSGTQLATFSAKIHLGHPAKRQKGCINYYCYYYSSTGDAKYIDSYIVHCCLILRVLSSKKWHSFINFMTLRIKDMRLSSIALFLDYHFHSKCSGDVGLRGSIRYKSNHLKNRETTLNANWWKPLKFLNALATICFFSFSENALTCIILTFMHIHG